MSKNQGEISVFGPIQNWWRNIETYSGFIAHRRRDNSAAIITNPGRLLAFLGVCTLVCASLVIFIDGLYLEAIRNPQWQIYSIFEYITRLGKVWWILILSGAVMVIVSIVSADRFRGAMSLVWHRVFLNAVFVFLSVAGSGVLVLALKNLIGRARPRATPLTEIWHSMPLGDHYLFASFPSGHSTTGGAIAMALAMLFPRWRYFFLPAGFFIALSRPVLGVHFPSDAFAGFVLGCVFSYYLGRYFARSRLLFRYTKTGAIELRGERGIGNWRKSKAATN